MTLTVRLFGAEILHVEVADTDAATDTGYDHDVGSVALDAGADQDVALGFTPSSVERE